MSKEFTMTRTIADMEVLREEPSWLVCRDRSGQLLRARALDLNQKAEPKAVERALRRASWLQHPGWCSLKEFVVDQDRLYVCGPLPEETSVPTYLAEKPQCLESLITWLYQLVEMLMEIHHQRTPIYLGSLTSADLRVTPKASLQVVGLDLAENFKLRFRASQSVQSPDSEPDGRTDIWCLGKLFREWLAWSNAEVKQKFDENRGLSQLISSMCSTYPERRPSNLNILKSRLDQLKYRPPAEQSGLLGKLPAAWELAREEYQKLLIGALCTFVTGIIVTGWLFPA